MFASAPRSLWGIGYHAGRVQSGRAPIPKNATWSKARYLHRVPAQHLRRRTCSSFEHTQGRKFDALSESYLAGAEAHYTATGIGADRSSTTRGTSFPIRSGASTSAFEETLLPARGWATAARRCGARPSRPTPTGRSGRAAILAADLYARLQLRRDAVADARPHGRQPAHARLLPGPLYGQRHDHACRSSCASASGGASDARSGAAPATSSPACDEFDWSQTLPNYGIGLPVGAQKTGERSPRLRIRQEDQRFPAEHQRSFLENVNI